jgi:hypothetical protein
MTAPERWVDDPLTDESLRSVLRGAPGVRSLDEVTRRRLSAKVARASAVPAVAAGWLFVKSAGAALGVVLGSGAIAVSAGIIDWSPPRAAPSSALAPPRAPQSRVNAPVVAPTPEAVPAVVPDAPPEALPAKPSPQPTLGSAAALPSASASGAGSLALEAALLELARAEMRSTPTVALSIAAEHAERFPRGQLASERTLIQIEALHRLGRDGEARVLARGVLGGAQAGLYRERVQHLLGEKFEP